MMIVRTSAIIGAVLLAVAGLAVLTAAQSAPVVMSPSMSVAVNLVMKLVSEAARVLKNNADGVDVDGPVGVGGEFLGGGPHTGPDREPQVDDGLEHRAASVPVAEMAEDNAADGACEISGGKGRERRHQRGDR